MSHPAPASSSRSPRHGCGALLLTATVVSGAAALGHQTVWIRALVDVLGANADTFSKVTGAFFLGLAIGAWVATRRVARTRPWLWVVAAEASVILLAVPLLFTHRFAFLLYESLFWATAGPWLLPLLLVTPPAAAMGVFLPWAIHALTLEERLARTAPVVLYALNTIGGIAGITLVLLWLFPQFGLIGAAISVLTLNAGVIGLLFLRHTLTQTNRETAKRISASNNRKSRIQNIERLLAFSSGFLILSMEVLFKHQFAQISINSLYSAGVVLAVVLTALAVPPLLLPWLLRTRISPGTILTWTLVAAGVLGALQPLHSMVWGHGLDMLAYQNGFGRYSTDLFLNGVHYLGAPLIAAGLVFPLLLFRVTARAPAEAGPAIAHLFLWNGLGGWAGAEAASSLLGPAFGLWSSLTVIGLAYLLLGGVFIITRLGNRHDNSEARGTAATSGLSWKATVPLGIAAAIILFSAVPVTRLPLVSPVFGEVIEARLGKEGVVAVVESEGGNRRMVMNNTYVLGGSRAWAHQERQAHLPLLLHGNPRSVGFIGIATGSTIAGATLHPTVEMIEAVDISRLTIDFANQHFGKHNRNLFADSRFQAFHHDARWIIAQRNNAYDVVIGDLFLPWREGTGRLYTTEHFESVRLALRPDGIFCQWLPLYQLSESQFIDILETFRTVFPEMILIRGDFFPDKPIIGLVGPIALDEAQWHSISNATRRLREIGKTGDPLTRHPEGIAMMLLGKPPEGNSSPNINTLANAHIELSAAQNILNGNPRWFTGLRFSDYSRAVQTVNKSLVNESFGPAHPAGQFFLELELAEGAGLSSAEKLRKSIDEKLPAALQDDPGADWALWPGSALRTQKRTRHASTPSSGAFPSEE